MFNDPFDASLPFLHDSAELTKENILKKLLIVGRYTWPEISEEELNQRAKERAASEDFKSKAYWKKFNDYGKEVVYKQFGIYSLTSKSDNLLMWSHYADSHKGFCVGFDKFELFRLIQGVLEKLITRRIFQPSLYSVMPTKSSTL